MEHINKTEEELFEEHRKIVAYSNTLVQYIKGEVDNYDKVALISASKLNGDYLITKFKDISKDFNSILVLAEEQVKNPIKYDLVMEEYNDSLEIINNLQQIYTEELDKITEAKFGMSNASYKELSQNLLTKTKEIQALNNVLNLVLPYVDKEKLSEDELNSIHKYLNKEY